MFHKAKNIFKNNLIYLIFRKAGCIIIIKGNIGGGWFYEKSDDYEYTLTINKKDNLKKVSC